MFGVRCEIRFAVHIGRTNAKEFSRRRSSIFAGVAGIIESQLSQAKNFALGRQKESRKNETETEYNSQSECITGYTKTSLFEGWYKLFIAWRIEQEVECIKHYGLLNTISQQTRLYLELVIRNKTENITDNS
ncbi:hypothetical protein PV325_008726 [Microctonus aethiopoides]|nr:hypothetical protein PV325_008726 [Microctonus aethiopoides]KAK0096837.1 hypothetical protein PV326_004186 [Microctonus aethiopoides]